ncbi:hypothetical protein BDV96DRAFT_475477, partial [Lophiotrema nucula]
LTPQTEHLEDFTALEWCNRILSDPGVTKIQKRVKLPPLNTDAPNNFFAKTLFKDDAVRAYLSLYRPGKGQRRNTVDARVSSDALLGREKVGEEGAIFSGSNGSGRAEKKEISYDPESPDTPEALLLVSLAPGLDGGIHRLHGGVTATLLDQVMGILISYAHENTSATAELNVKYKKAVRTPAVVLLRARIVREAGRWIETVAWME